MTTRPTLRISELADRLGYLDKINLAVIRDQGTRSPDSAALSMASAISLALNIAAQMIRTGEVERYRPGFSVSPATTRP